MADSSAIWNLHLIYQLSQIPAQFDNAVRGKVRALEGVTSVDSVPSHDTTTRLAFSTRFSNVIDGVWQFTLQGVRAALTKCATETAAG